MKQAAKDAPITIDSVVEIAKVYITNPEHIELIHRAYELADLHHAGQLRKSGEAYILHPLEVAHILAQWQAGPKTITAGLLHDIIEDTNVTKDEIEQDFSDDIANLVDGVTKLTKIEYISKEREQAENHRKMLLAMSKDIRVILIKLADRLHNIRTLKFLRPDKQIRIAAETMDIYVPIAHRLGIYEVKAEFEDTCLRYLKPDFFYGIANSIKKKKHEREAHVERMIERITGMIEESNLELISIKGRIKNIFSIYKKMEKQDKKFEEIYDLLAIRLIVRSLPECYTALGLIHANFQPIPNRFKDYIAMPKPNMYQSLHTTVIAKSGNIYEIQIRTPEMDEIAQKGVAAHWAYKENAKISQAQEQSEIQDKLKWYEMLNSYEGEVDDAANLLELVKGDIFNANVYVFTPKGDVFDLPPGSTPIDFAYRIHTDLGHKLTGAIVNGKIVPLSYKLTMGDVVEIKSNRNSFGPSEDWLNVIATSQARHKIRHFFNKERKKDNINKGEELFLYELKARQKSISDLDLEHLANMHKKLDVSNWDDLYHNIGRGHVLAKTILDKYFEEESVIDDQMLEREINEAVKTRPPAKARNRFGIIVDGLNNIDIKLAKCCHPVPGDKICGYVTKVSGITVHHVDCINVVGKDRFVDVWWDNGDTSAFTTKIRVCALARKNILSDILQKLTSINSDIMNLNTTNYKDTILIDLSLSVRDLDMLNRSANAIKTVGDVFSVERVM